MKKDNPVIGQDKLNLSNVVTRMTEPTPPFWKKVRNIGITIGAVGAAIVALPVALPAVVITIAGYLTAVGTVVTVVSQTASTER